MEEKDVPQSKDIPLQEVICPVYQEPEFLRRRRVEGEGA